MESVCVDGLALAETVSTLQRKWILEGWEKAPGEVFVFKKKAGIFYDWETMDLALYDSFDPQLRLARSPSEWSEAFEASFNRLHSALHAVVSEPVVLLGKDLAATTFEFCARLQRADRTIQGVICRTSHVFRMTKSGWKIVREHTSGHSVSKEEVEAQIAKIEPQKVDLFRL